MWKAINDLDRLPDMTAIDEPAVPLSTGGQRRGLRPTKEVAMIVSGVGLILVGGLLLLFGYGLATMVVDDTDWFLVLERKFELEYAGWMTIPSSLGLLVGIGLVFRGIFKLNSFGRNL